MPETRYARRGAISIVDEVVGEGPIDLVLVPGFVSTARSSGRKPNLAHFLTSQKKRLEIGRSRARPTINCRFDSARSNSATTPPAPGKESVARGELQTLTAAAVAAERFRNQEIDHRREASGGDRTNCSEQCRNSYQLLVFRRGAFGRGLEYLERS